MKSSPRSNACQNCSGDSIPPGSRHPIPITATGVTDAFFILLRPPRTPTIAW
ncbi:Uncharacterised protein [Mycobacteroides abscessus subsp. abscessus]|nr:Uncharacterised protein [Mycobacteroides abscessus subsp. abscessus]SKW35886.1 Uncharacterised protein [Mycobacteroides abscessus subsp. abscessus]